MEDGMRVPQAGTPAREESADPTDVDDRGTPLFKDGQRLSGYDHNDEAVYGDRHVEVGDAGAGDEARG